MKPTKTTSKNKKDNNSQKPQKPAKITVSQAFLEVLRLGCRDKEHALEDIIQFLTGVGITKTRKGTPLTKEHINKRYEATMRDVRLGKGRWAKYQLIEKKDLIQLVVKQQAH